MEARTFRTFRASLTTNVSCESAQLHIFKDDNKFNPPNTNNLLQMSVFKFLYLLTINAIYQTRWRRRCRHCATTRKTAGLIPNGVILFFIDFFHPAAL
jgi:hypothetical protein